MATTSRRRRSSSTSMPTSVYFVLLLCFGILFTGCSEQPTKPAYTTFTAEELEQAERLKQDAPVVVRSGTAAELTLLNAENTPTTVQRNPEYESFRTMNSPTFIVNNPTVNVRSEPNVRSTLLATFNRGATLNVTEIYDGAWAKIQFEEGEAYVALRFLSKALTEDQLEADKEQYKGMYFVNFSFLNVRKAPDTEAELLGTLPGQAIIKPLSLDEKWARIQFEGREAYAAREYLEPFEPNYSVRQSRFPLPIIEYNAKSDAVPLLLQTIEELKAEGVTFITFNDVYNLLKEQQVRDARVPPNTVILALTNLSPVTIDEVSDAVYASNIRAVGFIATKDIGINGITERKLINIQANGVEVQSSTHLSEDLRSLTNAQVQLEFQQSKALLEELIDTPILAVRYPSGSTNDRIMGLAADSGYLFGLSNAPGTEFTRSDLLRLPVVTIDITKTAEQMRALIRNEQPEVVE